MYIYKQQKLGVFVFARYRTCSLIQTVYRKKQRRKEDFYGYENVFSLVRRRK